MSKCSSLNSLRTLSLAEPEVWAFSSSVRLAPRTLPTAISLRDTRREGGWHLPDGRFESSPPCQGWDGVVDSPSPEGTTELFSRGATMTLDIGGIQPSLRDVCHRHF